MNKQKYTHLQQWVPHLKSKMKELPVKHYNYIMATFFFSIPAFEFLFVFIIKLVKRVEIIFISKLNVNKNQIK